MIIDDNGNDIDERFACIVETIIYFCWHGREGSDILGIPPTNKAHIDSNSA